MRRLEVAEAREHACDRFLHEILRFGEIPRPRRETSGGPALQARQESRRHDLQCERIARAHARQESDGRFAVEFGHLIIEERRHHTIAASAVTLSRLNRAYVEGRISDALSKRKSAECETERATVTGELSSLDRSATAFVATGERILELVKLAGILYKTQDPAEQRRVLESVP